jgi:hypothetical protein
MEITAMNLFRNKINLLVSVLLVISALFAGSALAQESQVPVGFDQLLVYMGAGTYDPNDPEYQAPDGDFWHREIMGRTDDEIAQNRAEAVEFFKTRFGIDPDNNDGVMLQSFIVDPRNEYRAYVVGNREVPAEGWVVRDGGWSLAVMNPAGLTLGGEFEGVQVPQGTMMVFGDYNIDTGAEPIIIRYQSGEPIVPQDAGWIAFRCELISEEFGRGLAQGISARVELENGLVNANIRNVLTFPGLGAN